MKPMIILLHLAMALALCSGCELTDEEDRSTPDREIPSPVTDFYRGADLSYVNEMQDCGASYTSAEGLSRDPYELFAEAGSNLTRLRLWHNPDWTSYSTYADVQVAINRAQSAGMQVLLDFHYSDTWADPGHQIIPAAWRAIANDLEVLEDSVYQYTYGVLSRLQQSGNLPEMVQVGNEINSEILQHPDQAYGTINWERNVRLLQRGIAAVRQAASDFDQDIQVMLHVAQPENALWWFEEATAAGLTDYDWIGISYYPRWSSYSLQELSSAVRKLTTFYDKELMVVETAYPFTMDNADAANNVMGANALLTDFPASPQGQYDYLVALEKRIIAGGGSGLVYWEPAWVSTPCSTRWGTGSHWDNATMFDHNYRAHQGLRYYHHE